MNENRRINVVYTSVPPTVKMGVEETISELTKYSEGSWVPSPLLFLFFFLPHFLFLHDTSGPSNVNILGVAVGYQTTI